MLGADLLAPLLAEQEVGGDGLLGGIGVLLDLVLSALFLDVVVLASLGDLLVLLCDNLGHGG